MLWRCHQSILCSGNRSLLCKYFSLFIIGSGLLPKQYAWTSQYLWQTVFHKKSDPTCFCCLGSQTIIPIKHEGEGLERSKWNLFIFILFSFQKSRNISRYRLSPVMNQTHFHHFMDVQVRVFVRTQHRHNRKSPRMLCNRLLSSVGCP